MALADVLNSESRRERNRLAALPRHAPCDLAGTMVTVPPLGSLLEDCFQPRGGV